MLKLNKEELPKTLFEIEAFLEIDKVKKYLFDFACISNEALLSESSIILDLDYEKSELRKWFNDECFLFEKNIIIIFIDDYLKNLNGYDFKTRLHQFQKVVSSIDPTYYSKLRRIKLKKIIKRING